MANKIPLQFVETHGFSVNRVLFAPSGDFLVGGGGIYGQPGELIVWDTSNYEIAHKRQCPNGIVDALAISGSSAFLAFSYVTSHTVELCTLPSLDQFAMVALIPPDAPRLPHGLPRTATHVVSMDFSNRSHHLAAGCWDMYAKMWNLSDGALFELTPQHRHNVDYVKFIADDTILLTATNQSVWLWSAEDRTLTKRLPFDHVEQTWSHVVNGHVLFSLSDWGILRVSACDDWSIEEFELGFKKHVRALDYSETSQTLAIGLADGRILLWSFAARRVIGNSRPFGEAVMSLSFAPDGVRLASVFARDENNLVLLDVSNCLSTRTG